MTGRWDKKPKEDTKRLERDFKAKRNVLKVLKHRLKEKESTAYLERSRHEIEMLKVQIKSIQSDGSDGEVMSETPTFVRRGIRTFYGIVED